MKVNYYVKKSWGRKLYKLHDEKQAKMFERLTRQKSMTLGDMRTLRKFGIEFIEVKEPGK